MWKSGGRTYFIDKETVSKLLKRSLSVIHIIHGEKRETFYPHFAHKLILFISTKLSTPSLCIRAWSISDLLDAVHQFIQDATEAVIRFLVLIDLVIGMDNGGMIPAAEEVANLGQGVFRHLPAEIHGNLARLYDLALARLGNQVLGGDVEIVTHSGLDGRHGSGPVVGRL